MGISWWSSGYYSVLSLPRAWIRSLIGKLRSHKPQTTAKINRLKNVKKDLFCLQFSNRQYSIVNYNRLVVHNIILLEVCTVDHLHSLLELRLILNPSSLTHQQEGRCWHQRSASLLPRQSQDLIQQTRPTVWERLLLATKGHVCNSCASA